MTLIEIMIVMVILTGVIVLGAMSLRAPSSDVRSDIRKLLILSKRLNQQAQLDQKIYRLTLSFDKEQPFYYVETTDKKTIETASTDAFDEDPDSSDFKIAKKFTKDRNSLPEGFFFKKLLLLEQGVYFDEGIAYIHYFPQGMADASALQITNTDETLSWTLIVNPLTGATRLVEGLYEAAELSRE